MRYAALSSMWKLGFSRHKLVDMDQRGKAAWYAAKYLSKSAAARVRASLHYGNPPISSRPQGQVSPQGERDNLTTQDDAISSAGLARRRRQPSPDLKEK